MRTLGFVMTMLVAAVVLVAPGAVVAGATTRTEARATAGSAVCARLETRIAGAPTIEHRIQDRIDGLEARLNGVSAARRARVAALVQPRIDRLELLSQQIGQRVAAARRLCGSRTT